MEILRGLHNIRDRHAGCVATIGNFDGVHRGHRMLLAHLQAKSEELGSPSLLITFEPQPREFLSAARTRSPQTTTDEVAPARLTRFREKVYALRSTGLLDRLLCIPFNERTRQLPATEMVERFLVDKLGVRHLVVGDDFRFGKDRTGDCAMLREAGNRLGFGVSCMDALAFGRERISSTRVRAALQAGDFGLAERLLGRPYAMMGRVVRGLRIGRTLGVPTANIRLQRHKAPLQGVFAVTVDGLGPTRQGAASIGTRPTVAGKEPLLEVHLFDFHDDIYGRLLTVAPRWKIREERHFPSLQALQEEMRRDLEKTRAFFNRGPRPPHWN